MSQDQRSKRKQKPLMNQNFIRPVEMLEMFCPFPEVFWSVYASDFDIK